MKNKETLPVIGILAILLTTIGLTYAFFQAQSSTPVTRDVRVLTHTVDMLTFSIDENMSVEATQLNFTNGGDAQDQVDGTTKNKLQTAMETALGTQADSCSSNSSIVSCHFGNFECGAKSGGVVD